MMRATCALLILLFALLALPAHAASLPDTIVLSPEVLAKTKQRVLARDRLVMPAYKSLIKEADRAVKAPAESVVLKPGPPPGGDMHDYWSLSPYWWPNPDTPDGLPYILRDGQRNPDADSDKYDRSRMRRMASDALTLALAFYLTGNEEYAGKGTALIWSWCCDSVTMTTPDMEFAQSRPGGANGHPSGIIETRDLIKVVEAARLLEPSHAWSKVVTKKVKKWFTRYVDWLRDSRFGHIESNAADNHGVWYAAQVAVFSLYIGQDDLARSIVAGITPHRIAHQIAPDGTLPEELKRPRSRHYTFFTIEAFFVLAAVGERLGVDMWHLEDGSGASIKKAFDAAAPYLAPGKQWPHGEPGAYDPFAFTPLFHRAALVYDAPRYLDNLIGLPTENLLRDRAQLFH